MSQTLEKPETKQFAAETARVLNLMIHALYTNRDIFLRELVSNASDACDKLRYAALTDSSLLKNQPVLSIHIGLNEKAKTITLTDTGIGMNREDLIANLGTIAKSGTSEFLAQIEAMSSSSPHRGEARRGADSETDASGSPHPNPPPMGEGVSEPNLIGQFGVGFYSAFMVAHRIVVESCKAGEDTAWRWESEGAGTYDIQPTAARMRGTTITLHLKKDAKEYLDRHKLGHIVGIYSDHIGFPITLTDSEGVTHTLNEAGAIWTRPKAEITDAQYQEFYHHVAHSPEKPWAVFHNKAEGKTEYTSLLFVPGMKPFDLFHPERRRRVKLYVKRVFITDEGVDLIPPYLRFLRGVVDSADLPLNISRETLQKSAVLDKIRDAVTSRVLGDLKKRAEKDPADYAKFWENFGAVLKEGLCEGNAPREKILEACRFYSTAGEALTSLADYKSRMREGQEAIYVLTGDSLAQLKASPQLEGFSKRSIEVLLLTDHVDDFWAGVTVKYGDLPFRSVVKAGADLEKFPLEDAANDAEKTPEQQANISTLCNVMKGLYGDAVREVRPTQKLGATAICLGVGEGDMDMRMERFLLEHKQLPKRAAKTVEINPTHPVIQSLAARVTADGLKPDTEDALWLLLDQAMIAEGEPVADAAAFARRLSQLMAQGLILRAA